MEVTITMYDWNRIVYTDEDNKLYIEFDVKIGNDRKHTVFTEIGKLR